MKADETSYRAYVEARMVWLHRTAYLLCGDWHTADDLVSVTLTKLLRHWCRVSQQGDPDPYVRRVLLRTWLDNRRRPWRREYVTSQPPDVAAPASDPTQRIAVMAELAKLPSQQRAVVVLRFFCDLSVEETANVLDCSPGTVKSRTSRALESLRAQLVQVSTMED